MNLISMIQNGVRRHGVLIEARGRPRGLAVHVHGTWGNFYTNSFIIPTLEVYRDLGYDAISVNVSGHDERAIGETPEMFPTSLTAWIDHVARGDRLVLQGHSLGANKVVAFLRQATHRVASVDQIVLLAPFDPPAFYAREASMTVEELRVWAGEFLEANGPEALVPSSIFGRYLISVGTLVKTIEEDGPWDVFPVRKRRLDVLDGLSCPTLVAIALRDDVCVPDPSTVLEVANTAARPVVVGIPDADHVFSDQSSVLAKSIRSAMASSSVARSSH